MSYLGLWVVDLLIIFIPTFILGYWIGEKIGFMNGWKARIKYERSKE